MPQTSESEREVVVVTHEYPPFAGGIARYIKSLVDELARAGVPVSVIAPFYPDEPEPNDTPGVSLIRPLRHHNVTPGIVLRTLMAVRARNRKAFFHAADIRSAFMLYVAWRLFGIRYGITIHGSEVSKFAGRGLKKRVFSAVYGSADVIFANSQATRDIFTANFGDDADVRVTHLGVDPTWFEPAPSAFESPALAALDDGRAIVCSVGRIDRRKGQLTTLRALKTGLESGAIGDATYVVAGPVVEEDYAQEIRQAADLLGVPVVMAGRISEGDLKRLYRQSVCHVLAAVPLEGKIEGFGLVILEAAAQSCPTIATRTGGIPEVIAEGETGLICEVEDVAELADAMARLLGDQALREHMSDACLAHAERFTWTACMRKTYGDILPLDGVGAD